MSSDPKLSHLELVCARLCLILRTLSTVCCVAPVRTVSLVTYERRHLLPAGSARRAALPVFRLLRGDTLHRSRSNLAGRPLLPAKFDLDRFRGGGLRPPKLKKIGILPI